MADETILHRSLKLTRITCANYKGLSKPGVIKVVKPLSTVLDLTNTILLPFKLLNEKTRITFEHNLRTYKQRIERNTK